MTKAMTHNNQELKTAFYFVDENISTYHYSLYFPKHSPLKEIFFKSIDKLITTGVVQKLENERIFALNRKILKVDD